MTGEFLSIHIHILSYNPEDINMSYSYPIRITYISHQFTSPARIVSHYKLCVNLVNVDVAIRPRHIVNADGNHTIGVR